MFSAALEGRKVSSLKRRVRSHLWRWEMKSCTPLWREGHVKVKMSKKDHVFGALLEVAMFKSARPCGTKRVSKLKWQKHHMFGARLEVEMLEKCTLLWREAHVEVCRSQNAEDTPFSGQFWQLRCRRSARCCGAKHMSKPKCQKTILAPLLEVEMPNKCTPLWRKAHSEVKFVKTCKGAMDSASCQEWAKCDGFATVSKTMAGVRRWKRVCTDACHVAGAVQEAYEPGMFGDQRQISWERLHFGASDRQVS